MSEAIESARLKIIEFRMAIFWFCLFSINSLCTCVVAAMAGCVWSTIGAQEKFTMIVAILGNWTGTIMAFVSRTAQKIKQTGELFPADTQFITRTHSETESVKASPEQPK